MVLLMKYDSVLDMDIELARAEDLQGLMESFPKGLPCNEMIFIRRTNEKTTQI